MLGVILDVDGTLLKSNEAHARSWVEAYSAFGYDVPFEKIYPLIGMGGDKLLAAVTPGLSDEDGVGKQVAERRKQILLDRYLDSLQPTPGARSLVEHMRTQGLSLAVASSSKEDELEALLRRAQVSDLLQETTTSSEVDNSKPAPDVVAVALGKLHLQPHEVVMIGDTPYDVESARKVGIGTVAVRTGGHNDNDLGDALAVYDDPADILAHYDSSPLAQLAISL